MEMDFGLRNCESLINARATFKEDDTAVSEAREIFLNKWSDEELLNETETLAKREREITGKVCGSCLKSTAAGFTAQGNVAQSISMPPKF